MKTRWLHHFLLAACSIMLAPPTGGVVGVAAAATTVRVGVYQNKPKVFVDEAGRPAGIFIDLLEAVAREEDWRIEYVPGSWGDGLSRLERGEIDLMPDVSWTAERTTRFAFNDVPVLSDWFEILGARGRAIESVLDLAGLRVAVLEKSVQAGSFVEMVAGFGLQAEAVPMPDYATGLDWLSRGDVDALVANRYLAQDVKNDGTWTRTRVVYNPTSLHFAAPMHGRGHVLATLDRYLTTWKDDAGSIYYETLRRWTGDGPRVVVPAYVSWALLGAFGLLFVVAAAAGGLRWQVRRKTRELQARTLELERTLAELDRTRRKALQQDRIAALNELAGGLIHDFNNVLAPITLYAEMLLEDERALADRGVAEDYLRGIVEASLHGAQIVNRMRGLYRKREAFVEPRPVDVGAAVRAVLPLAEVRWKQSVRGQRPPIRLNANLPDGQVVLIDEVELRQAVLNLLLNATDAMPDGGTLSVSVAGADDLVTVSVADTGKGMDEETRRACLNAFFTTKGDAGTGLGLAVVKGLCDRHGGRVDVESRPGAGSTFRLIFPAAARPQAETPGRDAIRPLTILAVDDEPLALDVIRAMLTSDGHRVDAETDPLAALERFEAGKYDVVVTDRSMPGLSGDRLALAIRGRDPSQALVMLSGTLPGQDDEKDLVDLPGLVRLVKPLRLSDLRRAFADLGFRQIAA